MPTNYAPIIAVWNTNTLPVGVTSNCTPLANTMTTQQKLDAVNGWVVPGPMVDVPVGPVIAYLAITGKLLVLEGYAASPPPGSNTLTVAAVTMFSKIANSQMPINSFQMSNTVIATALTGMMELMAADANTTISNTDVAAILGMASTYIPWWVSQGFPSQLSVMDLEANSCGLIPPGTY
jgi:hypothetical protein